MTANVSVAGGAWLPSWRAFVAAGLVIGYLALIGEALHCQFVPKNHHEHQGNSPQQVDHATHCLLANHSSATVASTSVVSIPVLHATGLPGTSRYYRYATPPFALLPARAPPSV